MGLFKYLLVGTAVAAGYNYLTKKRPDGSTMMDEIKEKAPEWMDKAKEFGTGVKEKMNNETSTVDKY
ncbi:MAG: YtxH domain-containing protein [Daejeonella sp.]